MTDHEASPGSERRRAERLLAELMRDLETRKKPVRVVEKSRFWHQRAAAKALWLVTLGGQNRYLTDYVTTLGHTIYVPDDWERRSAAARLETLRHEVVHVEQFETWGIPVMVLVYGLLPLPFGLAYGRARLEWQAYAESLRAIADLHGLEAARAPHVHAHIVARFTGPDYGWMWPFPRMVKRWIDDELAAIETRGARAAQEGDRPTGPRGASEPA